MAAMHLDSYPQLVAENPLSAVILSHWFAWAAAHQNSSG
jgi:hypothetical protein